MRHRWCQSAPRVNFPQVVYLSVFCSNKLHKKTSFSSFRACFPGPGSGLKVKIKVVGLRSTGKPRITAGARLYRTCFTRR